MAINTSLVDFLQALQNSGFYGSVELKYENGRLTIARKTETLKLEDNQNQRRNNRGNNAIEHSN
jgi:hypothetical protein